MLNGTLFQFFHWYTPADGSLWEMVRTEAHKLAEMGVTAVWLPPACKCADGQEGHGYDVYDMYDLGEFDQKGTVRTRYGTKQQYIEAAKAVQAAGMQLYVDIVSNHFSGADETEWITVRKVDPENRNEFISDPLRIEAYTKFTFPGRKGQYSSFIWDHTCFTGVDYAKNSGEKAIFKIIEDQGDKWEPMISDEKGNFDYLLGADIEFRNPHVQEEFRRWGEWYWNLLKFDGVRLDATKHISPDFINSWLDAMNKIRGRDLFAVGEFWAPGNLEIMRKFIDVTHGKICLFDATLQNNLHTASRAGKEYDLTGIFRDTLVAGSPDLAVTLVANHDTQPLQALEAPVDPWFKPLAYALLLLREKGYPSVFYPDLYGAHYRDTGNDGKEYEIWMEPVEGLEKLINCRKLFAYGPQRDYIDHPNCIGWTREGAEEHASSGCAVLLSNGDAGAKHMEMGKSHAGKKYVDFLGKRKEEITIGEDGWAEFYCEPGSVSVWVSGHLKTV